MKSIISFILIISLLFFQSLKAQTNTNDTTARDTRFGKSTKNTTDKQKKSNPKIENPWVFGGNVGLSFGDVSNVLLAPRVGYKFTNKITAGGSLTYQYYAVKAYNIQSSSYGGSVYGQYNVSPSFYAQAEYEQLNLAFFSINQNNQISSNRYWVPALFVGAGYNSGSPGYNISLLYDVLQNPYSPYKAGNFGVAGLSLRMGLQF